MQSDLFAKHFSVCSAFRVSVGCLLPITVAASTLTPADLKQSDEHICAGLKQLSVWEDAAQAAVLVEEEKAAKAAAPPAESGAAKKKSRKVKGKPASKFVPFVGRLPPVTASVIANLFRLISDSSSASGSSSSRFSMTETESSNISF